MRDCADPDPFDVLFEGSLDEAVFRALSASERRYVLYYLLEHRSAPLEELADVVTGWSNARTPGMATVNDRNRIRSALHHRHLPVLEKAGLVRRDDTGVERVAFPDPVCDLVRWACRVEGVGGDRRDG